MYVYTYSRNQKRELIIVMLQKLQYYESTAYTAQIRTMQNYKCYCTKLQTVPHKTTYTKLQTKLCAHATHKVSKLHAKQAH